MELLHAQNGLLIKAKTLNLDLPPGFTNINLQQIQQAIAYEKDDPATEQHLQEYQNLPDGGYELCISVRQPSDDAEIGRNCQQFSIANPKKDNIPPSDTLSKKKKYPIQFNGFSEISGNYGSRKGTLSQIPANYAQWVFCPQVSVVSFPINGNLFLTTQQEEAKQNINSYSIQFNTIQFRENLKSRATDRIRNYEKYTGKAGKKSLQVDEELDRVKRILEQPNVVKELRQLDELKQIEAQLQDTLTADTNKTDSLKTRKKALYEIEQKRKGYERLMKKKEQLEALKVKMDKVKKLQEQYKNIDPDNLENNEQLLEKADSMAKNSKQAKKWRRKAADKKEEKLKQSKDRKRFTWLKWRKKVKKEEVKKAKDLKKEDIEKFDVKKLKDPSVLHHKLREHKAISKTEQILVRIKSMGIGQAYPNYSEFTMNNVPVRGFGIEVEPGNFYVALTGGNVQKALFTPDMADNTYKRSLMGGGFGYGRKDGNHVYAYLLSFQDKGELPPTIDTALKQPTPGANKVIATVFKINLHENKYFLDGEIAGTQTIDDVEYHGGNNISLLGENYSFNHNGQRRWFKNIITQDAPNINTYVGNAYKISLIGKFNKDLTTVSLSNKRISPLFESYGTPFLQRDLMAYELKVAQAFLKRRVNAASMIKYQRDNLKKNKSRTSTFLNMGFDVSCSFPKYPFVKVSYLPVIQQNDSTSFKTTILNIMSSYSFKIKETNHTTNASYVNQKSKFHADSLNFSSNIFMLAHTINILKNYNINIGCNFNNDKRADSTLNTIIGTLGGSVVLYKIWNIGGGINHLMNRKENKTGFYAESSVQFAKYFTFTLRAERNIYNSLFYQEYNPDYREVLVRVALVTRW